MRGGMENERERRRERMREIQDDGGGREERIE